MQTICKGARITGPANMQNQDELAEFLGQQPHIVKLLTIVQGLAIEDCWVAAGLIRNAVWNHLHGLPTEPVPGSDVDIVYCDARDASLARDLAIEGCLRTEHPDVPWCVHNQARMHAVNGDLPYCDVADAIRCWPETATAIAARIDGGHVKILAPHGIKDLVGLIVRPTSTCARKKRAYRRRIAEKDWRQRWPKLTFVEV
jgi:hypothetical protein